MRARSLKAGGAKTDNSRVTIGGNRRASGAQLSSCHWLWAAAALLLALVTALTAWGPASDATFQRPHLLFTVATVSALTCIVAATAVIALADRRDLAELGLLGSSLLSASVMPLARGLMTPDVLYNETPAFRAAAFLALPVAVVVAAPLFTPHSRFGRWAARHWRDWTLISLVGVFVLASLLVFYPDAFRAPSPSNVMSIVGAATMVVAVIVISLRQLRFYEIGRSAANLVASLSLLLLGVGALLPLETHTYSLGFWWLQLAGGLGVAGACVGLALSRRMSEHARELLGPVLARDPLIAFELGLSPTVHQFVAALQQKDQVTRDHVVRTAEMAIRVGERCNLEGRQLRDLGLAALLHDVGKLRVPDEVLTKPARLTPAEYEIIKRHAVDGEQMLALERTLASVAPLVRSHHERIDGGGYPDGLSGDAIPLPSRIIAVCDAFDAMTHDRQYRSALPVGLAFAVLSEHAGSQWDPRVIEHAKVVFATMPTPDALDAIGRSETLAAVGAPSSVDSSATRLPDDVSALLAAVDAEI
jgi:HD-GYP domain-containing protein (c-di-GMP phosphodiesterase class II)